MLSALVAVFKVLISPAANVLPRLIARRYFNEERLDKKFDLTLRDIRPVTVSGSPTMLGLWLKAVNHSALDVTIVSFETDVWFGQPTAALTTAIPTIVPAHSTVTDIYLKTILGAEQVARVHDTGLQSNRLGSRQYRSAQSHGRTRL